MLRITHAIWLSALFFAAAIAPVFAAPEDPSRMKDCLAAVYLSQLEYRREHGKFSEKFSHLKLEKNPDCRGLQIQITRATSEAFVAEATNGHATFRIDAERRLEEIR